VAILMVDSKYSGPLLVRTYQVGGDSKTTVSLAGSSSIDSEIAYKEEHRGVDVVLGRQTAGGAVYLEGVHPSSSWRAWFGMLSATGPGCFGLQVDGDTFTEFIVFEVNSGKPPPG